MPFAAPRICGCGKVVAYGQICECRAAAKREYDMRRPSARARGYDSSWDKARKVFLAANPNCRMPGCGKPATVVDHIEPHRGNKALFWNRANWQPLCTTCHSSRKQSMECRAETP